MHISLIMMFNIYVCVMSLKSYFAGNFYFAYTLEANAFLWSFNPTFLLALHYISSVRWNLSATSVLKPQMSSSDLLGDFIAQSLDWWWFLWCFVFLAVFWSIQIKSRVQHNIAITTHSLRCFLPQTQAEALNISKNKGQYNCLSYLKLLYSLN